MSDTDQLKEELLAIYRRWFAALPTHDAAFFERVLADDWYYVNVSGEVRGKKEYFDVMESVAPDAAPNRMVELTARSFDPLVVVHGLYVIATPNATTSGGDTRFTAVWTRRGDDLVALAHHATPVAKHS